MTGRITRRPFTACAYRFSLTVGDVSGGAGNVTEAQCLDLSGDFSLDFKSCISQHKVLVWEGDCDPVYVPCGEGVERGKRCQDLVYRMEVSGLGEGSEGGSSDCLASYNGTFILRGSYCNGPYPDPNANDYGKNYYPWTGCDLTSNRKTVSGGTYGLCNGLDECDTDYGGGNLSCTKAGLRGGYPIWKTSYAPVLGGYSVGYDDAVWLIPVACAESTLGFFDNVIVAMGGYVLLDHQQLGDDTLVFKKWSIYDTGSPCSSPCTDSMPDTITLTRVFIDDDGVIGPYVNDRVRSKWHLEYDIAATKWTLRSYDRVDYPIYSLVDGSPCDGNEKVLVLEAPPFGSSDGCAIAPPTVTITPACPPDREARQHSRSKQTGSIKRMCGCACDDEPDDLRYKCQSKCSSTSTAGCESYSSDGIECKYPKPLDCCDYCTEDKTPCAYEALFDCEIKHNGVSIAAPVVTLRKDCYFENVCEYVAVGPSPNAADGGTGAQPVCATCSDSCLSGCSWDAWQTAACPSEPCEFPSAACDDAAVFTIDLPSEIVHVFCAYGTNPNVPAQTATLTSVGSSTWNTSSSTASPMANFSLYWVNGCPLLNFYALSGICVETGYYKPTATFDCDGSNVFEFVTSNVGAEGVNWPRTLTVTRVP